MASTATPTRADFEALLNEQLGGAGEDGFEGRVVKGTNFINIRDAGDPVELAMRYEEEGADELVFLDITASHEQRDTIVGLARRTARWSTPTASRATTW